MRRVWLWFQGEGLDFPLRLHTGDEIRWVPPSYHAIHGVLVNSVYAGAYVYGKSRSERYVDEQTGELRKRVRRLPRSEWSVLIPEHHEGFIDWETYEANLERIATNTRPRAHQPGGAQSEMISKSKTVTAQSLS